MQSTWQQVNNKIMTQSFQELFEQSLASVNDLKTGTLISAEVVGIDGNRVILNAGLKSESIVPLTEFGNDGVNVGDTVDVIIDSVENGRGETKLSREKARRAVVWQKLEEVHQSGENIIGTILERVKGGFTVNLDGLNAFLPGSLMDVKPTKEMGNLDGTEMELRIIKMDTRRNNIVVSRRAVMEQEDSAERAARLEQLQEGDEVVGVVKNITDYGAFVDLGGADGLLHITDMAWKRVKHPQDILNVGDEVKVKVLKFDREKNRVSLGMKQLGEDPWVNIERRYPAGSRVFGKVTNVTDYGCFVEVEAGVEGLVHMSEMDWTNKNIHPSKVVQLNDEVEVMVLEINEDRRRISLGVKQCKENPWQAYAGSHKEGEKVKGAVRSITDFGLFIGLDGEIDGLVHLSDISWNESGEEAVKNFNKGDEVEAVILAIDPERERVSLGIKQLEDDPIANFLNGIADDQVINATVAEVDAKKAIMTIGEGVNALMRISDYSIDRVDDLRKELHVGDQLDVKLLSKERKNGELLVSHKATLDTSILKSAAESSTTLGDLLKDQMGD